MPRKEIPTSSDIANLYRLLREEKSLAKETSYPFINLVWAPFLTLMFSQTTNKRLYVPILVWLCLNIKDYCDLSEETTFLVAKGLELLILDPVLLYMAYKIWHLLSYAILSIFPSGTATTKQTLKARKLKNQLARKEELDPAIFELELHVDTLRKRKTWETLMTLFSLAFGGYILENYLGILDDLSETYFGSRNFIPNAIFLSVALWPLQFISGKWNDYKAESTIQKYKNQLETMTLNNEWTVKKHKKVGEASFFIECNPKHTAQLKINKQTIKVKNKDHINEIFRLFIEENIPVYSTGSGKIYVGYTTIKQQRIEKLAGILSERIITLVKNNTLIDNLKAQLRKIHSIFNITPRGIDGYFDINNNKIQLSIQSIESLTKQDSYNQLLKILKDCYGQNSVLAKPDTIHISYDSNVKSNYEKIIGLPSSQNQQGISTAKVWHDRDPIPNTPPQKKTKRKANSSPKPKTVNHSSVPLPEEIKWPKIKARYDRSLGPHFFGRAYPMHVSWKEEGTLFAVIDDRVLKQAAPLCSYYGRGRYKQNT